MAAPPRISVIISTYNDARYLPLAVASVLSQHYRDFELIVVDDGLTDEAPSLLQGFAGRLRHVRRPHAGVTPTLNHGASLATGQYLWFFGADDVLLPGALDKAVARMGADDRAAFCYGRVGYIDSDGAPTAPLRGWPSANATLTASDLVREFMHQRFVIPSACLIRKSAFDEVRGFDEALSYGEDTEMFFRMALRWRVLFLAETLALRRKHPRAITARADMARQEQAWARILAGGRAAPPGSVDARWLEAAVHFAMAYQAYKTGNTASRRHAVKSLRAGSARFGASTDALRASWLVFKTCLPSWVRRNASHSRRGAAAP